MVTLAFGTIALVVLNEWADLTQGARGLAVAKPFVFGVKIDAWRFYWIVCVCFALSWVVMDRIIASPYGRAFQALQGSPIAADSVGVSPVNYKVLAFTLSAAFTGLAGGLYAFSEEYITPQSFNFEMTIVFLLALIVGGRTSRWGALVGATLAVWLPNLLGNIATFHIMIVASTVILAAIAAWCAIGGSRDWRIWLPAAISGGVMVASFQLSTMTEQRLTILGLILLGAIVYLPNGIVGAVAELFDKGRPQTVESVAPEALRFALSRRDMGQSADLVLDNVTVRFGGLKALSGITTAIEAGFTHGLIGPNGAGKSTLINTLTGLYTPTTGTILIGKRSVAGIGMAEIARLGVARTFQNIQLFGQMTVLQNVLVGRHRSFRSNLLEAKKLKPHHATHWRVYRRQKVAADMLAVLRLDAANREIADCVLVPSSAMTKRYLGYRMSLIFLAKRPASKTSRNWFKRSRLVSAKAKLLPDAVNESISGTRLTPDRCKASRPGPILDASAFEEFGVGRFLFYVGRIALFGGILNVFVALRGVSGGVGGRLYQDRAG
jgi:ABC-type branched-subunit amino acid transport system permease subunit